MKIFISWSGEESKQVALLLKVWLKKILQASEPWMSDADIVPGARWSQTIAGELQNSDFGIICITPQNRAAEWINFEAGALSIALGENGETERKVVPLLIGFDRRDAVSAGPLGVFNAVLFTKEDIWKLVLALNNELNVKVDAENLAELFELYWPQLNAKVQELHAASPTPQPAPLTSDDMIREILGLVRSMQVDLTRNKQPDPSSPSETLARLLVSTSGLTDSSAARWWIAEGKSSKSTSSRLTNRELQVAKLAQRGLSNREIAKELNVSQRTVEGHLYQVFAKLGITGKNHLTHELRDQDVAEDEDKE